MENSNTTVHDNASNKELLEKFIVLEINNENFIIPLLYVNEIVRVQEVTEAPHQPAWIKGIMNLRDSVISLVDTRTRLGMKSFLDDIRYKFIQHKEAHIKRVNTIESLTRNFNITDLQVAERAVCTFDAFIKSLVTKQDLNDILKTKMRDIELLHDNMHSKVKQALKLLGSNNIKEAIVVATELQSNFMPKFVACMDDIIKSIYDVTSNEIAVIIEFEGSHFAMLADEIKKMQTFDLSRRQKGSLTDNPFISGVFDNEEGLYQELDLKGVLNDEFVMNIGGTLEIKEPTQKQTVNLKELGKKAEAQLA